YNAGDASVRTGMAFLVAAGSLGTSGTLDLADADWRFIGEAASDQAGKHVAGAGDIDDDGYADILVGAPNLDIGATNEGGVYVFLGMDLGTASDLQLYDAHATLTGEAGGDRVGEAATDAGDVDGDGMSDVLIGASGNDDAGTSAGKAYLLYGDSITDDAVLSDADFGWTGEAAGDVAGASVAGLGDIDGDGTDDLLVGAWGSDDAASNAGKAYILLGSSLPADGAPLSSASVTLLGEGVDDFAAYAVAGPGDVDGDGRGDVLLGAYGDAPSGSRSGRSYLVYASSLAGGSTLDLGSADHRFSGEAGSDLSGIRVAGAGDVDNDGLADLMVGAPANDTAGSNAGKVYLILAENIPATRNIGLGTVDYAFTGEAIGDQAGYGIAGVGDVDGDGFSDMLIGSWGDNTGGIDAGKAYLMRSP
ncbi:MAG: integrin alpha, partial [Myxococcota bacterium]|nr:integrin alpha [Myxococcota bacterium]